MFLIVWEYDVDPANAPLFEQQYGEGGVWAQFFARADGYVRTMLLHKIDGGYVTLDFWRARESFETFMAREREQYEAIDRECESLTASERLVGRFESEREPSEVR